MPYGPLGYYTSHEMLFDYDVPAEKAFSWVCHSADDRILLRAEMSKKFAVLPECEIMSFNKPAYRIVRELNQCVDGVPVPHVVMNQWVEYSSIDFVSKHLDTQFLLTNTYFVGSKQKYAIKFRFGGYVVSF